MEIKRLTPFFERFRGPYFTFGLHFSKEFDYYLYEINLIFFRLGVVYLRNYV